MISQDIEDTYKKLDAKKQRYDKEIRVPNLIRGAGWIILVLSIILAGVIDEFIFYGSFLYTLVFLLVCGFVLVRIGEKNVEKIISLGLSTNEGQFLNVVKTLKLLDEYLETNAEILRDKSIKQFLKVKKYLDEASYSQVSSNHKYALSPFWRELIKEIYNNFEVLTNSINKKIIPILKNGEKEDIQKLWPFLEDLARFFLEFSPNKLNALTKSIEKLPSFEKYMYPQPSFFAKLRQHPYFNPIVIGIAILSFGYGFYTISTIYFGISKDAAFSGTAAVVAALLIVVFTLLYEKIRIR